MRKLLSIFLMLLLCVGLTGCAVIDDVKHMVNEVQNMPNTAEKQEFYEDYFINNKFQFKGESMTITTSNGVMKFITDENGNKAYCVKVHDEEGNIDLSEFFFLGDELYAHSAKGEKDVWYHSADEEVVNRYKTQVGEITDLESMISLDFIQAEYEETSGIFDYIEVSNGTLNKKLWIQVDSETYKISSITLIDKTTKEKSIFVFDNIKTIDFTPPENPKALTL